LTRPPLRDDHHPPGHHPPTTTPPDQARGCPLRLGHPLRPPRTSSTTPARRRRPYPTRPNGRSPVTAALLAGHAAGLRCGKNTPVTGTTYASRPRPTATAAGWVPKTSLRYGRWEIRARSQATGSEERQTSNHRLSALARLRHVAGRRRVRLHGEQRPGGSAPWPHALPAARPESRRGPEMPAGPYSVPQLPASSGPTTRHRLPGRCPGFTSTRVIQCAPGPMYQTSSSTTRRHQQQPATSTSTGPGSTRSRA